MSDPDIRSLRPPDDPLDRRQAGNTGTQWVRDAFHEQDEKIDQVAADVREISSDLKRSWRDGNPDKHRADHELFKVREEERVRLETAYAVERAERDLERAERRELWKNAKKDAVGYSVKAVIAVVLTLLAIGLNSCVGKYAERRVPAIKVLEDQINAAAVLKQQISD